MARGPKVGSSGMSRDQEQDILEMAITKLGLSRRLAVVSGKDKKGELRWMVADLQTGIRYNTVEEAVKAIKKTTPNYSKVARSRERNVSGPAKTVKKGSAVNSKVMGQPASGSYMSVAEQELFNPLFNEKKRRVRHSDDAVEFVSEFIDSSDNSVEHYGDKGMKWGVRRDRERATARATKKFTKLNAKVRSAERGVQKAQEKSLKKRQKADSAILFKKRKARKAAKSIDAVNRAHVRTQRATLKAKKWFDSMTDVLGKETVRSISKEYGDVGKRYVDLKIDDIMKNVGSDIDMRNLSYYYSERGKKR